MLPTALLITVLLAAPADPLTNYREESVPTGRLLARGWLPDDRARVSRFVEKSLRAIEARLQLKLDRSFTTVLTPDEFDFRKVVRHLAGGYEVGKGVVGVALPGSRTLVIRGGGSTAATMGVTIKHEIAHLVLHLGLERSIPKWLDEGVATWVSGYRLPPSEESFLMVLARVGGLYRLAELESRFPRVHAAATAAYSQSFLIISYLVETHGEAVVTELLREVSARGTARGIERITGADTATFERDFVRWLLGRRSIAWQILHLVNVWTIAGLLAVAAIIRHLWKRRRLLARLAEEEASEASEASALSDQATRGGEGA